MDLAYLGDMLNVDENVVEDILSLGQQIKLLESEEKRLMKLKSVYEELGENGVALHIILCESEVERIMKLYFEVTTEAPEAENVRRQFRGQEAQARFMATKPESVKDDLARVMRELEKARKEMDTLETQAGEKKEI